MTKTLVFVRFGERRIVPQITEALKPHMLRAQIVPFPGAVVTLMETESTLEEVANSAHAVGANFLLFEVDMENGKMPNEVMANLTKIATVANGVSAGSADPTLDQVIEKMRTHGRESLTALEIKILENGL